MGYACPVCDDPQADARHLANHLAFTAILGDDAHEAWLDEHAPDWADEGEAELAERVAEYADEREYPQVFEDTVDRAARGDDLFDSEGHAGHDHLSREVGHGGDGVPYQRADVDPDPDTEAVLEEARAMTREMLDDAETESADSDADEDDADG